MTRPANPHQHIHPVARVRRLVAFLLAWRRAGWAYALGRPGNYLPGPEDLPEPKGDEVDPTPEWTPIDLDPSVRSGGVMGVYLEELEADQLAGVACVECGRRDDEMVPVAQGPRGQLVACRDGCGQGPGYTEPPLDWCPACGELGAACTCCQNCGAPHGRGQFGFCNECAPFFDPHAPGCACGGCPEPEDVDG